MNRLRSLLPFAVLSIAASGLAQSARDVVIFDTPDGSHFLLAPTVGPNPAPVVHWYVAIPTPLDDDPSGAIGLSRAVLRASLHGTRTHGSRDATAEGRALAELDRVRAEVWRAVGPDSKGSLPVDLEAKFRAATAHAAALAEPTAWRRAIAESPADDVVLEEPAGGSLLRIDAPPASLPRLAVLLREWREEAVLRGVHDAQVAVRTELATLVETTSGRMRKEILGTTYLGAAAARYVEGSGSFVPLADAERHRQKLVHPSRTLHVLTGGFDAKQVQAMLTAAFVASELPPSPPPTVLVPADARARRSVVPAEDAQGVALAWPVPASATRLELAALGGFLAGSERALLPRMMARDGVAHVDFVAPFPANSTNPMFVLEIMGAPGGAASDALEAATLARLRDLATTTSEGELQAAGGRARNALRVVTGNPQRLGRELAIACGLFGHTAASVIDPGAAPDSRRLLSLADEMFGAGPRTVVAVTGTR